MLISHRSRLRRRIVAVELPFLGLSYHVSRLHKMCGRELTLLGRTSHVRWDPLRVRTELRKWRASVDGTGAVLVLEVHRTFVIAFRHDGESVRERNLMCRTIWTGNEGGGVGM